MAATLSSGSARHSGAEQLEREIEATFDLVDRMQQHSRREDLPGWVWLRAARASWLIGNVEWSWDFYKRAAVALTEYTLDTARRTVTVEHYAQMALAAAWGSGQRDVLRDSAMQIDQACEQMLSNLDMTPDPLIRVGLLVTRMRAAWYREQSTLVRDWDIEIERRAGALDAWGKASWQSERGILSHAAIRAMTIFKGSSGRLPPPGQMTPLEQATTAVKALDRRLYEQSAKPPTITDLVDEELISLVAVLRSSNAKLPLLRLATEPGTLGRPS